MHLFDQDRALSAQESFRYQTRISANWSINGVPNGGYLMAIVAGAMQRQSDREATPIITANFLSRCEPGEALVTVEKIAQSNQFVRFQSSLVQAGDERMRASGTFASLPQECPLDRYESTAPILPPPEDCVLIPALPGYSLFEHMQIRLDPGCAGWMTTGQLAEKSEIKGWIRFKEERPFDLAALLLIADSFPPPVLSTHGMVAWVPTIEFSVNIRSLPQSSWLKGFFRTRYITCGLLAEDGEIWDADDRLVAISRQIAQYRTA